MKPMRIGIPALACSLGAAGSKADDFADGYTAAHTGDYGKAYAFWRSAAEQGHAQAQFDLGLMYHAGLFVGTDESEAVIWYERAAESGYSPAQEYLAVADQEGWFGLRQDFVKSAYWYNRLKGGKP